MYRLVDYMLLSYSALYGALLVIMVIIGDAKFQRVEVFLYIPYKACFIS